MTDREKPEVKELEVVLPLPNLFLSEPPHLATSLSFSFLKRCWFKIASMDTLHQFMQNHSLIGT